MPARKKAAEADAPADDATLYYRAAALKLVRGFGYGDLAVAVDLAAWFADAPDGVPAREDAIGAHLGHPFNPERVAASMAAVERDEAFILTGEVPE